MGCRESLYAVVESALGTPKASPVLNTDAWYFNLPEDDSFSGVMTREKVVIAHGGGCAIPFDRVPGKCMTSINWKGLVYPSLDNFLIRFALQRISGGSPWTTTERSGDLASASMYKLWETNDGAIKRKRFAGCKVASLELSCSASDPKLKFSASLQAVREVGNPVDSSSDPDATEFPASTAANLPTGPYIHQNSSGNVSVGGVVLTKYESLSLRVTNTLDVLHGDGYFPATIGLTGRTIAATIQRQLLDTPDFRSFSQTVADKATSIEFDNGSNSFKIDLGAKCYIDSYTQQLSNSKLFLETITIQSQLDPGTGSDVVLTFT